MWMNSTKERGNRSAIAAALGAALLFGASTPLAKQLLASMHPAMLAALLYLGSGVVLLVFWAASHRHRGGTGLQRHDWPWLAGAILTGGVLGPVLLMVGLSRIGAADASLLLNMESVLTAGVAWMVFREHADRRIVVGMGLIVAGGIILALPGRQMQIGSAYGALLIIAACACWAIDNNLTRRVSASDAIFIAGLKGAVAGGVNLTLALSIGAQLPAGMQVAATGLVGLLGYGISLVLFVLALRGLGAARTGAYFSTAPFIGAAIAVLAFGEHATVSFWLAALLMAAGVWLHLSERHGHVHTHEFDQHEHPHEHDQHHLHEHDFAWDGRAPHRHLHRHSVMTHSHPHYPDIHHRHGHRRS